MADIAVYHTHVYHEECLPGGIGSTPYLHVPPAHLGVECRNSVTWELVAKHRVLSTENQLRRWPPDFSPYHVVGSTTIALPTLSYVYVPSKGRHVLHPSSEKSQKRAELWSLDQPATRYFGETQRMFDGKPMCRFKEPWTASSTYS